MHFSAGDTRTESNSCPDPMVAGWQLSAGHRPPQEQNLVSFPATSIIPQSVSKGHPDLSRNLPAVCKENPKPRASHAWGKVRRPAVSPAGVSFLSSPPPSPALVPLPTFHHAGAGAGFLGRALVDQLPSC